MAHSRSASCRFELLWNSRYSCLSPRLAGSCQRRERYLGTVGDSGTFMHRHSAIAELVKDLTKVGNK